MNPQDKKQNANMSDNAMTLSAAECRQFAQKVSELTTIIYGQRNQIGLLAEERNRLLQMTRIVAAERDHLSAEKIGQERKISVMLQQNMALTKNFQKLDQERSSLAVEMQQMGSEFAKLSNEKCWLAEKVDEVTKQSHIIEEDLKTTQNQFQALSLENQRLFSSLEEEIQKNINLNQRIEEMIQNNKAFADREITIKTSQNLGDIWTHYDQSNIAPEGMYLTFQHHDPRLMVPENQMEALRNPMAVPADENADCANFPWGFANSTVDGLNEPKNEIEISSGEFHEWNRSVSTRPRQSETLEKLVEKFASWTSELVLLQEPTKARNEGSLGIRSPSHSAKLSNDTKNVIETVNGHITIALGPHNVKIATPIASLRSRRDATPNADGNQNEDDEEEKSEVHRFSSHPGAFFGSCFLLGGERYDMVKPESFLFGDNADLDLIGTKCVKFPYSSQPINDPVRTLNALINIRRDSLKLVKCKSGENGETSDLLSLEFCFDCDSSCYIQIHFFAKEHLHNGSVQFVYKNPDIKPSSIYYFDVGAEQYFNKFVIDPTKYDISSMHYENGSYFPLLIELRATDCGIEQMQSTMASIERSTDQSSSFVVKPLKQRLVADGVVYLLQEIYGIENKEHDLSDENGSECIICMSDIRDTVILPCRHLCICNGCAETLRYKLNNCPICRSPFRALLQLKTMRVISTVSITDQSISSQHRSQTRYETVTLVEALNGPISHVQSCVIPASQLGYNVNMPHEMAKSLNSRSSKRSLRAPAVVQQVLTLNTQSPKNDESTVYIEMKPTESTIKAAEVDCSAEIDSSSHEIFTNDEDRISHPPSQSSMHNENGDT